MTVAELAEKLSNDPDNPELLRAAKEIYHFHVDSVPNYGFCCDHIATEDFNLDDPSMRFCIENALKKKHADCLAILEFLEKFTERVRYNILFEAIPLCEACGHHTVDHSNYVLPPGLAPFHQRYECTQCDCKDYLGE